MGNFFVVPAVELIDTPAHFSLPYRVQRAEDTDRLYGLFLGMQGPVLASGEKRTLRPGAANLLRPQSAGLWSKAPVPDPHEVHQ